MTTHLSAVKAAAAKVEDLTAKYNRLVGEQNDLVTRSTPLTDGQNNRLDDIARAMSKLDGEIERARSEYRSALEAGADAGAFGTEGGSSSLTFIDNTETARAAWDVDVDRLSRTQLIDRANRAVGETFDRKLERFTPSAAEAVTEMLRQPDQREVSRVAQWALAASDPAYESAFAKLVQDPTRGHLEWDDVERAAYRRVNEVRRAMSLTDANGGYMVPFTLDPAVLLTNDGSNNPIRQLATIKRITTDAWQGITSAGATAEWKSEAAEVADGSPTLAQPSIPTFFGDAFVPYSFEFSGDAVDAMSELTRVLVDAADNLMATAYTTGNGTTAPQGITVGLAGTSSEINTTGSEAIVASDAYALQNALPARFSANATWQSHIAVANTFRQFETTNGAHAFPELRDNPPTLLGKRWFENSNMDGSINAAATANNYVLIYGDVRQGYYIVDRVGTTVELVPHLVGSNRRPTGQRGMLLWFRTGGEVVVPQALRMLDVPTTA